jgi:hypothetical protein
MSSSNWIFALLGSALIGLVAWLFQRAVAGIDKKVDDTCTQMTKTAVAVQEMRVEMTGYNQLVKYLSEDVKELKSENRVLRDAHHTFDKFIAVQQALHKISPPLS